LAAEQGGGIAAHLEYWTIQLGEGSFMQLHLDTVLLSLLVAGLILGFARWLSARLVDGVPTGAQNAVEALLDFINQTVKDNFPVHNPIIAPLALTIFVFVFLCNTLDVLPAYLAHNIAGLFGLHAFRQVPTNDVNLPVAMAVVVFLMTLYYEFKLKPVHFVKELLLQPFAALLLGAKNPIVKLVGVALIPLNFVLKVIEELAKPLSLSFRLFGNMFAGEVVFLLIADLLLVAHLSELASIGGLIKEAAGLAVLLGWSLFHLFIGLLQAFIFMILSVVYLSIAHQPAEEH